MNIEVLKLALLRLEELNKTSIGGPCLPAEIDGAMDALRASLDTSQSHSCTWPACNPEAGEQEPVGEVVSYGSHLHPEWFSGRVPLLGTLLYTAPPAQAKEIEALKAATHVRIPADEYEALRQLQFYTRIPGQEDMVLRFLKEIEDCDHRKNAAIAQQKETR